MKLHLLAAPLAIACLLAGPGPAAPTIVPQGETWRSVANLPDWSGVWQATSWRKHVYSGGQAPYKDLDPPFNAATEKRFGELRATTLAHGNVKSRSDHCIVLGMPGGLDHPETRLQFLFTPGQVTLSAAEFTRRIHTDGRRHFLDLETFQGDSIGRWQAGGVLVVDTVALDPTNEIILGVQLGRNAHVVERFRKAGANMIVADTIVTAPEVLARPWRYQVVFERDAKPLWEQDCAQGGGRDIDAKTGEQGFDLSLPKEN